MAVLLRIGAIVMICIFALVPDRVPAQGAVAGLDDAEFAQALELWLADEEAGSLPRLANLAKTGNAAAQVLLGMIDKNVALQGPWLALLGKAERRELLRDKGGLSGVSWLRRQPEGSVAWKWVRVLDSRADIEEVLEFASLNETRALRTGLIALEARQETGFAEVADDPRYPSSMRYLVLREWQKSGVSADSMASALSEMHPGDPQVGLVVQRGAQQSDLAGWLEVSDMASPLRALCRSHCAPGFSACLVAGYEALGGYRRLAVLGSPLASLISDARFNGSERAQKAVLRKALSFAFLTEQRLEPIKETDQCFADLMFEEGQRF